MNCPSGAGWQYEPKYDGFRCLAHRRRNRVNLQSKNQKPLERYFPEVARGIEQIAEDGLRARRRARHRRRLVRSLQLRLASRPAGSIVVAEQAKECVAGGFRAPQIQGTSPRGNPASARAAASRTLRRSWRAAILAKSLGPILGERTAPDHATRPCVFPMCLSPSEGRPRTQRAGIVHAARGRRATSSISTLGAARQRRDLHGRARRLVGTEALGVDRVQLREVAEVGDEDRGLHHLVEARAGLGGALPRGCRRPARPAPRCRRECRPRASAAAGPR